MLNFISLLLCRLWNSMPARLHTLKNAESFASAKVSPLIPITNKAFRFAAIDNQIILVEGMYYCNIFSWHYFNTNYNPSQCLQCIKRALARGQGMPGHPLLHPLVPSHTLECSAISTLDNVNFDLWNVWSHGPRVSAIFLPSHFCVSSPRAQFDALPQVAL